MRKNIVALLLGAAAAVLLLEIALMITGGIHARRYAVLPAAPPGGPFVLCVGDSFTVGIGAPPEKSYPRQLQEILRACCPKIPYTVVNLGRSSTNTTTALSTLRRDLATYRPRYVFLLTGGANQWNYRGYRPERGVFSVLRARMSEVHVVKLIGLVRYALREREDTARPVKPNAIRPSAPVVGLSERARRAQSYIEQGMRHLGEDEQSAAMACFERALREDPANGESFVGMGHIHRLRGEYAAAAESYRYAVRLTSAPEAYFMLGKSLVDNREYQNAIRVFGAGICRAPCDPVNRNYIGISMVLDRAGDETATRDELARMLQGVKKTCGDNPLLQAYTDMVAGGRKRMQDDTARWVARDVAEMISLCRQAGATVFVMGYPANAYANMNCTLRATAAEQNAAYIDNERVFDVLLERSPRGKYFSPDGHCNAEGYRVMAETAAHALMADHAS